MKKLTKKQITKMAKKTVHNTMDEIEQMLLDEIHEVMRAESILDILGTDDHAEISFDIYQETKKIILEFRKKIN